MVQGNLIDNNNYSTDCHVRKEVIIKFVYRLSKHHHNLP